MSTALAPAVAPTVVPVAGSTARRTGPSFPALTGLEIRKSLSTRSGRAVASLAVLVGPLGVLLATMTSGSGVAAAELPTAAPIPAPITVNAVPPATTANTAGHTPTQVTPAVKSASAPTAPATPRTASTKPSAAMAEAFAASTRPRCGTSR